MEEKTSYKFDMHTHTHEGSPDSKVDFEDFIKILQRKGFDGMLVSDHDSYEGYEYWESHLKDKYPDFIVLKGIEYDTFGTGHFLVVMPSGFDAPLLTHRGMRLEELEEFVHSNGGILGPAHPCGEPFLSMFSTGRFKRDYRYAKKLDFLEGFNACEYEKDNLRAQAIAKNAHIPVTGGSDSHWYDCAGEGFTEFFEPINTEDDLIAYIKAKKPTNIGGNRYYGTLRDRLGRLNKLLVYGFFPYNKWGAFRHKKDRRAFLKR